jgi:hypothetical protein
MNQGIHHKLNNIAMCQWFLFHDNIIYKYCLYQCGFKIINEVHHLSHKNMNRTKFILDGFNEDYLLKFVLLQLFSYLLYVCLTILH